jgi:hypothetical protein
MATDQGIPGCGVLADVPEKQPTALVVAGDTLPGGNTLCTS